MNNKADDENISHIPEKRLIELSKSTIEILSTDEKTHLTNCDRCTRILGALFRLERGHY